jgi:hypothetical protein
MFRRTILLAISVIAIGTGSTFAVACEEGDITCRQGARLYCSCETLTLGSRERTCRWMYLGGRCTSFETPVPDGRNDSASNLLYRVTHRQEFGGSL